MTRDGTEDDGTPEPAPPPYLRVVRGDPTPEELAALVVALQAATPAAAEPTGHYRRGRWNDVESLLPPTLHAGPGAWRASGRLRGIRTNADR